MQYNNNKNYKIVYNIYFIVFVVVFNTIQETGCGLFHSFFAGIPGTNIVFLALSTVICAQPLDCVVPFPGKMIPKKMAPCPKCGHFVFLCFRFSL